MNWSRNCCLRWNLQSKNGIRIKIGILCEMKIRNWNEITGKNGIRIEIEFFFRMEITLMGTLSFPSLILPLPFPTEIFLLVHEFCCTLNIKFRAVMQWILCGTRGPLDSGPLGLGACPCTLMLAYAAALTYPFCICIFNPTSSKTAIITLNAPKSGCSHVWYWWHDAAEEQQESPAVADKPARRLRKVCTVYVRAVGL